MAVSGNYAYVAADVAGLLVIDIRNPAAPVTVGMLDTPGSARAVSVVGTYAYIADGSAGLQVVDLSHPAAPARVGGLDTDGFATANCAKSIVTRGGV